jgi:hypothetical protein
LILPKIGNGSPAVHFRQKYFGIERELSFAFHSRPSLCRSSFENAGHFTASPQEWTIRWPQRRTPYKGAHGDVKARIIAEVDKDFTKQPLYEIEKHLAG